MVCSNLIELRTSLRPALLDHLMSVPNQLSVLEVNIDEVSVDEFLRVLRYPHLGSLIDLTVTSLGNEDGLGRIIMEISSRLQITKFGLRGSFSPTHIDHLAKMTTLNDLSLYFLPKYLVSLKPWLDRFGLKSEEGMSSQISEGVKRDVRTAFRKVKRNPRIHVVLHEYGGHVSDIELAP